LAKAPGCRQTALFKLGRGGVARKEGLGKKRNDRTKCQGGGAKLKRVFGVLFLLWGGGGVGALTTTEKNLFAGKGESVGQAFVRVQGGGVGHLCRMVRHKKGDRKLTGKAINRKNQKKRGEKVVKVQTGAHSEIGWVNRKTRKRLEELLNLR